MPAHIAVLLEKGARRSPSVDEIDQIIARDEGLLWLDIEQPNEHDIALLQREFGFHPLALEDVQKAHQRPKLDRYDHYFFFVFYAVRLTEGAPLQFQEIDFFIGKNYLVTIHRAPCPELASIAERWQQQAEMNPHLSHLALLLYTILDTFFDQYFTLLDRLAEQAEEIEEAIIASANNAVLGDLFRLRKTLLTLRRILAPERDALNAFLRFDDNLFGDDAMLYFQDLYDHVLRILDTVDTYRDLLAGMLEAHLSVTSNQLNQVMRTLTAWSIILMTLALIAGIYGMNFKNMPELNLWWGYYAVLAGMAILGIGLFALFRHIRWL
ncbi:MAG: magnesium/cobalt transporter CorA [Thermorudis peleae]|nr:magnesium/cobalt transporter CorA [Thermorudis peleae]